MGQEVRVGPGEHHFRVGDQLPFGGGGLTLCGLSWWNSHQRGIGEGAWAWLCGCLRNPEGAVTGRLCTGQVTEGGGL